MKRLLFILLILFSVSAKSQSPITINGSGNPININSSGDQAYINLGKYAPVDYTGTINNELQNLTEGEEDSLYYGWPVTYSSEEKRAVVIRSGIIHGYDPNSKMVRFLTSDGANTWSKDTIFSDSGYDIRNYGGGTTTKGIILIFYFRWDGVNGESRCARSTNGGTTFSHSADLGKYDAGTNSSPHGPLVELDNGDLLQSFYGVSGATAYNWTLKSTDNGRSWGNPVLIASGTAMYEPSVAYLGNGKLIAAIRHDVGATDKDMEIYNSSDYGASWSYIGKCRHAPALFDLPGVSPLLFKRDVDSTVIISTARGTYNNFIQMILPFGSSDNTGFSRSFYEAQPKTTNNIEFGYPGTLFFNSNDTARLIGFYDLSTRYVSGDFFTDVLVSSAFRMKEAITQKTSGSYASSPVAFSPDNYIVNEILVYNSPTNPTWQHKIRTAGSYSIHVVADFTGGGSSRTLNIQRYTSGGAFSENMFTEAGSGNSYDFTTTETMGTNEAIVLQIVHDASPLVPVLIRMTITKL